MPDVGEHTRASFRGLGSGGLRSSARCGLWRLWWSTKIRRTRSRWPRFTISSQSRHSERMVRTKRSAIAFACGARTGVLMISIPSLAKVASKPAVNLQSRSRIRNRAGEGWSARVQTNWRACWVYPGAGRVGCAAGEVDAPAAQLNEEEHVQPLQRDRIDGEEVDRERALGLCP
jgi:hypothetical protein